MRTNRLAAPALAAAALGLIMLFTAQFPYFQLVGGIAVTGGYTVGLQVVLALFLLTVIDDFGDPHALSAGRERASGKANAPAPFSTHSALIRFYLRRPGAALVGGFGAACSLSAVAIGLLDRGQIAMQPWGLRYSELAVGVVLALSALPQLLKRGLGFFGWCWGMAAGAALAQLVLDSNVRETSTVISWAAYATVLSLVGLSVKGRRLLVRRRQAEGGSS